MTTHQPVATLGRPAACAQRRAQTQVTGAGLHFATPDRAEPWARRHLAVALLVAAIGAVGMAVCWYVGAGKLTYDDQVPWLLGSMFCAGITVVGGVYWLLCGFRQVALAHHEVARYLGPWFEEARASLAPTGLDLDAGTLVASPGMHRVHRPDCLMARGKADLEPVSAAQRAARGLTGCGACGS